MTKSIVMDKYPVHTLEIQKTETTFKNIADFLSYYKEKIENHPIATFIALFDHYTHTKSIDGEINPDIKDAQNIVFCFGAMIPNTKILAARPRSIAIAELENSFIVEFMEAPNEKLQVVMEEWTKQIILK
ncbi:MAG: hypothetical protein U9P38_07915 [Campylobacterota bacterium]|nr:hypothetical protein [Campylobacterota bacterium]